MSSTTNSSGQSKARRLTPGGVLTFFGYGLAAVLVVIAGLIFTGQVGARVVLTNSMSPTINPGDLVVSYNWLKPSVGQIAIYKANNIEGKARAEFVHRVVEGSATTGYTFKGDNNPVIDPFKADVSAVVGVVQFTIRNAGVFLQPIFVAGFFVALVLLYFLVAFIRHRRSLAKELAPQPETFQTKKDAVMTERKSLSPRVRSLLISLGALVLVYAVLAGLGAAKLFGFEHPQVGPKLAVGNANSTIVAVLPSSTVSVGQYAIATLNGVRNFVRVDAVTDTGYTVATTTGTANIGRDKLDGTMLFFIPFIGYLWLPFDV